MTRKRRIFLIFFVFSVVVAPVAFYSGFAWSAHDIINRYGLKREAHNAVKHAYAAAALYNGLRCVGIPRETAEKALLSLGALNEWVELYVKADEDSLGEIRKDLHNNWVGIIASEWLIAHAPGKSLSAIMAMFAKERIVMLSPPFVKSDAQGTRKITEAQDWLVQNQPDIEKRVLAALRRAAY